MAQEIMVMGATYEDVPSVRLPDSNGVFHPFTDTSDTTAIASDVAQGKVFHLANGSTATGTASGGGGTLVTKSITANGTYSAEDDNADGYSEVTVNVSGGGGGDDGSLKGIIERTVTTLTLPSDLTKVGDYAFYNCSNLELTSLPSGVAQFGLYAFYGCVKITLSELPDSVTNIGSYAFHRCSSIESISCNGALVSIGNFAFQRCTKLSQIRFPNSRANIVTNTFGSTTASNACKALEFADVGSPTSIAANAFANCYKLQTLVLRKDSVCTLANVSAFLKTPLRGYSGLTGTVYVPSNLIASYQTASNWNTLYNDGTVTFVPLEGSAYE